MGPGVFAPVPQPAATWKIQIDVRGYGPIPPPAQAEASMQEVQCCVSRVSPPFQCCVLQQSLEPDALPGLLAWLHGYKRDISFLHSLCGEQPYADAVITALIGTQQLTRVDLTSPRESTLQIISLCTFVTKCTLDAPKQKLNVKCLWTLPKLAVLELAEGTFTGVRLSSQLTRLQAKVSIGVDGKEGCGLQNLVVASSQKIGLQDGICACTGLRKLACKHSWFHTSKAACKLITKRSVCLSGLSALTKLEVLDLQTIEPSLQLEPVYALDLQAVVAFA